MSFFKRLSWLFQRRKRFPHDDIHRAGELAEMRLLIIRLLVKITVGRFTNRSEFPILMVGEGKSTW